MNDTQAPEHAFVILAAIDESDSAASVIKAAASYGGGRPGARLHVVNAYLPLSTRSPLDRAAVAAMDAENHARSKERMQALIEQASTEAHVASITGHLVTGAPTDVILGVAAKLRADLIVVGTHDYRGLSRFLLGSVSEVVVRKAHCPVALVRPINYPPSSVPQIEPPCPDCVRTRSETNDKSQWCERHAQHHAQAILHYEYPNSFGIGAQTFRP